MEVRQVVYDGVGGLKLNDMSSVDGKIASLKYDGSQYHLHIANGRAYALTSKRISKKTGMYSDRIDNFPDLKEMKFPFKKETIYVCEVCAEHLKKDFEEERFYSGSGNPYIWSKRASFVASIMNANPETIEQRYPDGNPLALVVFSVIMYEGKNVAHESFTKKYIRYIKPNFSPAGKFGGKIKSRKIHSLTLMDVDEIMEIDTDMFFNGEIRNDNFGFEGFVINELDTNRALKIKRMKNADCIVIDFDWNSTGKYADNGWIKSIVVGCFVGNNIKTKKQNSLTKKEIDKFVAEKKLIVVGKISGFDEQLRADISQNPDDYLGLPVECEFMEWTGKAMRHPRISEKGFRTDKLIKRCTIDQME